MERRELGIGRFATMPIRYVARLLSDDEVWDEETEEEENSEYVPAVVVLVSYLVELDILLGHREVFWPRPTLVPVAV